MERVLGIGGYFLRSASDPDALAAWYRDALGFDLDEQGVWEQQPGPTVFAAFDPGTTYFPAEQRVMLNLRVADLDAMLAQLRSVGAAVDDEVQDMEGIGRFGWVADPDGNRIELWQPS